MALPSREVLISQVRAAENRAEAIKEVAALYGVADCTIRRHLRGVQGQGEANIPRSEAGHVSNIFEESAQEETSEVEPAEEHASNSEGEEEFQDPGPENPGQWVEGDRYIYNGTLDKYTFFLRSTTKKQVLQGSTIRAMKRAYSRMGEDSTINEVARSFQIRRDIFIEIKTILGWTHDSDIFTDEEHMFREPEELLQDVVQARRSQLDQEWNRKDWRETQRDAKRFRQLEHFIVNPLLERIGEVAPMLQPPPMVLIPRAKRRFAALTSSGELHYNKRGWVGETGDSYNREIADSRFEETTKAMVNEIMTFGRPEKIIYIVGNDDLHVDGMKPLTTAGTPQDVDGSSRQMVDEFFEIQVRELQRLRSVAPLQIVLSAGNHNTFLAYMVMKMLSVQFRDAKDVEVNLTGEMRSYVRYGNSLIGATHGHQVKPINLMATMGIEATRDFGETLYKYWMTAHLHTLAVEPLVGGIRLQMPSLSGTDMWHADNGYKSVPGLTGYIIDHEYGIRNMIVSQAVDTLPISRTSFNRYQQAV